MCFVKVDKTCDMGKMNTFGKLGAAVVGESSKFYHVQALSCSQYGEAAPYFIFWISADDLSQNRVFWNCPKRGVKACIK